MKQELNWTLEDSKRMEEMFTPDRLVTVLSQAVSNLSVKKILWLIRLCRTAVATNI